MHKFYKKDVGNDKKRKKEEQKNKEARQKAVAIKKKAKVATIITNSLHVDVLENKRVRRDKHPGLIPPVDKTSDDDILESKKSVMLQR